MISLFTRAMISSTVLPALGSEGGLAAGLAWALGGGGLAAGLGAGFGSGAGLPGFSSCGVCAPGAGASGAGASAGGCCGAEEEDSPGVGCCAAAGAAV